MVKKLKQYNFYDCIRKNLLRKIPRSKEKAERSVKTAFKWLEEAEKNLKGKAFNSSVMSSYLAMFHSARAILFFDGFREKSHYCIARYLEEKYVKKDMLEDKWVEIFDHYRELRHDDQYSTNFFVTKEEAEATFKTANEFVERINKLFNSLL